MVKGSIRKELTNTRRFLIITGLILILVGLFVVTQSEGFLLPYADYFGLAEHSKREVQIFAPTLLQVGGSNHTFLTADLEQGAPLRGSLEVQGGREIGFYVMDEPAYLDWRAGKPAEVALAKPFVISYNFTFTPTESGRYYFVFDNQDPSRRAVLFNLSLQEEVVTIAPDVEYGGLLGVVIGILLLLVALRPRRRKSQAVELPSSSWECRHCGEANKASEVFCQKCGRSRE